MFLVGGLSRTTRCGPSVGSSDISVAIVKKGILPYDLFASRISSELHNGFYVERPASVEAHSTKGVFKVEPDGHELVYAKVKFGRASANAVEILDGLNEGDRLVISDMSVWMQFDRIRLY